MQNEKMPSRRLLCGFAEWKKNCVSPLIRLHHSRMENKNRKLTKIRFACVKRHFWCFSICTRTNKRTHEHKHISWQLIHVSCVCVCVCVWRTFEFIFINEYSPCGCIVDSTCATWLIRVLMLAYGKIRAVRCKNHWKPLSRDFCSRFLCFFSLSIRWNFELKLLSNQQNPLLAVADRGFQSILSILDQISIRIVEPMQIYGKVRVFIDFNSVRMVFSCFFFLFGLISTIRFEWLNHDSQIKLFN